MKLPVKPRRAVLNLPEEKAPSEGRAGKLRFDFNENTLGCSPRVRAALARVRLAEWATYPAYAATRRRIAKFFGVAAGELLLTNGADDGLRVVVDAFVERGDHILIVEPTFDMYRYYAALAGARVVGLCYDRQMRFPLRAVLGALRQRPRIFFLANPNNPTGTVVTQDEMRQILGAARHTVVVADEAYAEFSGVTVLPWIRRYRNLVVARTFSKAAGLAGLRLGCLFAHGDLASVLRRAQAPFPVNRAALVAAEASLCDGGHLRRYVREVGASKRDLEAVLQRFGVTVFPSGANFLLADFGPRAPRLLRALRLLGILLRDRSADFGRAGYVRITIGTRAQTRQLIRALEALW